MLGGRDRFAAFFFPYFSSFLGGWKFGKTCAGCYRATGAEEGLD